jgi:hypothetical protein
MRESKAIDLNGKPIVVYGLLVRDITDILPLWGELSANFTPAKALEVSQRVLEKATNLTWADIRDLSFSDLDKIESAFREVNEPFLRRSSQGKSLLRTMGAEKLLDLAIKWLVANAEIFSESSLRERREKLLGEKVFVLPEVEATK